MSIHASQEAMDFSQSLARHRQRPSHAKERSTTHRRGDFEAAGGIGRLDDFERDGAFRQVWSADDWTYPGLDIL